MRAKFIGGISHGMIMDVNPDLQVIMIPEPIGHNVDWDIASMNKPVKDIGVFHSYKLWKRMSKAGHNQEESLYFMYLSAGKMIKL